MAAIITDQLRITNAKNFVSAVRNSNNSYYSFIGLSNATEYNIDWDSFPPAPKDNFDEENSYWDTIISLKKISDGDVRQVVKKIKWQSGVTYDMYRHDISRTNLSSSGATSLYSSNYYVINEDYRVYICLQNGTDPENPNGRPSLDEPTFTDLEPFTAGESGDGYVWKYLYTIKPSELIKFDSTNYMPVPNDWETNSEFNLIRNNALVSGQIKIVTIKNRGVGVGTANRVYSGVPIRGDGTGAQATIVINNDSKVESVTVSNGGSGYTYGTIDLRAGNVPLGSTTPVFDVIISPKNGHGYDIYRELGAYNVLLFTRLENNVDNPDLIVGNKVARVGIVENPQEFNSTNTLASNLVSSAYAIRLGAGSSIATYTPNSYIRQTIGVGITAIGRVISYDKNTGVLKYWQDRTFVGFNSDGTKNPSPTFGFNLNRFASSPSSGGNLTIVGDSSSVAINTSFTGITTTINNRIYNLGQFFENGLSNPEVKKYSGNILYVDNRPSITRSPNQKEDIKVILQF